MVATFPNFSEITLEHKKQIEAFWKNFEPYSDYNFTSMYSYNTGSMGAVSFLKENLVLKFPDYNTNQLTLSFLGKSDVTSTATTLLDWAKDNQLNGVLTLVGQEVVDKIEKDSGLIISEDTGNHDYIISAIEMAELKGDRWKSIRKEIRHFKGSHPNYEFRTVDTSDIAVRKDFRELFASWEQQKDKVHADTKTELEALGRSFDLFNEPSHLAFGLYVNDRLIGYSTNQIVHNGFYMGHFGKADGNYPGAYQIMEHECAKFFLERGCEFMNFEQDLGIPELRQAKRGWNPIGYLKKYTIKPK